MESRPTRSELEILTILWQRGSSSVREVHEELGRAKDVGYTTVLKQLQVLADKGLVVRDTDSKAHVYSAAVKQADAQKSLTDDLASKLFGGSVAQLAMQALSTKRATPEELAEVRRLLDRLEKQS